MSVKENPDTCNLTHSNFEMIHKTFVWQEWTILEELFYLEFVSNLINLQSSLKVDPDHVPADHLPSVPSSTSLNTTKGDNKGTAKKKVTCQIVNKAESVC